MKIFILTVLLLTGQVFAKTAIAKKPVQRQIASSCGGATSFQNATSVSCVLKNFNDDLSEKPVAKSMDVGEGGTTADVFSDESFRVEASSYSIGACNEGDFLFVSDLKSGSTFSTKSGDISFRSKGGKTGYNVSCVFKR